MGNETGWRLGFREARVNNNILVLFSLLLHVTKGKWERFSTPTLML